MKKKSLVGLFTISACFTLGSTSFAAVASTPVNTTFAPSISQVSPQSIHGEAVIRLKVGERIMVSGWNFNVLFNYTGSLGYVIQDGVYEWVGVQPGVAVVTCNLPNDVEMYYTFIVE
ncbi:hypothetical protein GC101_10860 [Paenibacillus sp. LMG 31459]|uniref:Blue (type 1) copper domain-containing protein n=1 Tax=Paenibacillus phytohabitans TaxID=2654978 RepID=A0ABX1YFX8_9BACL|nr:hypothetical protein [Paenibacillus phytohabitans]NOU79379.1 hypothetical protein [Paenibacillus phytohabitans]